MSTRTFKFNTLWTSLLFTFSIALLTQNVKAEDPLLGIIKAIKCVGCDSGKVTLVIHDPIDVRDFEVSIPDADYFKIVTPLPGKRVFDHGDGCFYWDVTSKAAKKDTNKAMAKALGTDSENGLLKKSPSHDSNSVAKIDSAKVVTVGKDGKKLSKKMLAQLAKKQALLAKHSKKPVLDSAAVVDSTKISIDNSAQPDASASDMPKPENVEPTVKASRCIPFLRLESSKPSSK